MTGTDLKSEKPKALHVVVTDPESGKELLNFESSVVICGAVEGELNTEKNKVPVFYLGNIQQLMFMLNVIESQVRNHIQKTIETEKKMNEVLDEKPDKNLAN